MRTVEPATLLHVFPTFGPGGTQLRMASILNSLGASYRHRIIALDGDCRALSALHPDIQVACDERPSKPRLGPYAFAFMNLIRSLRPSAVLTYNWGSIEATLGALLAARRPVIHNECGFGAEEAAGLLPRRVWARRLILNRIFSTVVTSRTLLGIANTQYKLRSGKVQLIRTGVDVTRYQPRENRAGREAYGIVAGTVVFGYVGGLRAEKNLGLLLRAFQLAQLRDSKLMLIGDGPCRSELETLAAELGIRRQLVFAGHQADPASHFAMMDVFVMSSATEQVSNAQLEAMASGLPVVCTDVGDSRDLLGANGESGVVPSSDTGAYARALREVAESAELRAAWGAANRQRAITHHSKDRMVREYGELLERAVTGRSPAT
jgi:glycosyltransferase involved in cell wall biosynthesis